MKLHQPAEYLLKYFSISNTTASKVIGKTETILHQGSIEKYIYIILSGAVRAVYRCENEEFTIRFGYRNSVITSINSLLSGEPSNFSIETIRKTELITISKTEFFDAVKQSAEFRKLYVAMLEELIIQQMEREIDLLTTSPLERYRRVIKRSPELFRQIPLKYIASYLRMSPETLSRLRKIDLNQDSQV
ncbi:MAG: Crp/Fnr family transcriptional regulator [Bacteroidia bacterium]